MIKYKIRKDTYFAPNIEESKFERETKHWLFDSKGHKTAKKDSYKEYHDSFEAAKTRLAELNAMAIEKCNAIIEREKVTIQELCERAIKIAELSK